MARIQEIGPYSAYAIAVKYGYKGTEEEWVKEQEANRKAAEAAAAAAAQSAKDADASASGVAQSGQQAVQSIKDAKTEALEAIDAANAALPNPTQSDAGKVPTVKADGSAYELAGPYAPLSAAIRPTASGNPVNITDSVEWPLLGLKVYGKSTQDGTPSPESPVPIVSAGASGSVETTITGKNLLTGRLYYGKYNNGFAYISNQDSVSLPFAPAREETGVCYVVSAKKGVTYTFSVTNPNANANLITTLYRTFEDAFNYNSAISRVEGGLSNSITPAEDGILVCLIAGTWTDGTTTIHECTASELLQLEIGSTATAYETPHSQSITATTPNGLPGIPVDSGGNYTDASGQQWVCDVKDLDGKTETQNVLNLTFDGSDDENWVIRSRNDSVKYALILVPRAMRQYDTWLICNISEPRSWTPSQNICFINEFNEFVVSFVANQDIFESVSAFKMWLSKNPIKLIYQLETPTTTPLSDDELTAYRALHTYDGATVVSTAEDVAGIEVRYVADGEKYIDRKISEAIASAAETKLAAYDTLSGAILEGVNEV